MQTACDPTDLSFCLHCLREVPLGLPTSTEQRVRTKEKGKRNVLVIYKCGERGTLLAYLPLSSFGLVVSAKTSGVHTTMKGERGRVNAGDLCMETIF